MRSRGSRGIGHLFVLHSRTHRGFTRSVGVAPRGVTIGGSRRTFVTGVVRTVRGGVSGVSCAMSRLTVSAKIDHAGLCGEVGRVLKVAPGRFVHGIGVGCTTHLLARASGSMARISLVINFRAPQCFDRYFGQMFNMLPARCEKAKRSSIGGKISWFQIGGFFRCYEVSNGRSSASRTPRGNCYRVF